jgi:hypothetical protein
MAPKNGAQEWDRKGKCKIDQQIPKENKPMMETNKTVCGVNRNQVALK